MGQWIYLKDVVTLRLDQKKCTGCGMCLNVCPHEVLSLTNSKVDIVNRDACMECGACARNCPVNAFTVRTGVGCAAAMINSMLGRQKACGCSIESSEERSKNLSECSQGEDRASCC